ncbi:lysylphosphatidylglycerol synthase transmembrane domain-containing protein [Paenibacillus lignilyticus]|uniref:Phosphatidylglycerol lysyltransferase n=1 Tax=Paenibacillus lignilyticus TaxID=1172615 RepID=A0ABS5CG30_9BACL|nr:lysylphosphatidylglycerol synthase transmembrane domain-containing protein [Paenibacillus lignilyticus]MBP3964809.1 flippase-like domain-containing protein [Paenibacillus lignilyticus]
MKRAVIIGGGLVMTAVFVWLSMQWFHGRQMDAAFKRLLHSPGWIAAMTVGYGCSFWLKAVAWRLYVARENEDRLRTYMYPLLVSLLVNHILPVKLGDLARTGMLARQSKVRFDDALHSVAMMRLLDMVSLLLIGSIGAITLGLSVSPRFLLVMIVLGVVMLALAAWLSRKWKPFQRHFDRLWTTIRSRRGAAVALLTLASWVLEGAVVYGVVHALNLQVGLLQAVWANSMTIAGQLFHVTPGGIGTYETTLTASLGLLGIAGSDGYTAALLSHGYKFGFAYTAGAAALVLGAVSWRELKEWFGLKDRGRQKKS